MTDRAQFEAMLEALINEDQETAKEIFHNIVVGKSREIYEELLSEDFNLEEEDEDEDTKESYEEESVDSEESDDSEASSDEEEGDEEPAFGGDDAEGEESDGDIEDRVMDLEDALDELKAEFEQLMAGEEGEEQGGDMGDMDMDLDSMGGGDDDLEMEEDDMMSMPTEQFNEYVNKVGTPKHGDNGVNTKSIVAGKNDMGGTTANIAKGGEAKGEGTKGGLLAPTTKEENFGNMNKPGANAGKQAFKKREPGHGAEKKGSSETADNKRSIVGSRK